MVLFPNCKINLGLHITAKRKDGYHELETVFFPVPLKDVIELIRSDELHFQAYGLAIPGDIDTNLCVKAYRLLKQDFSDLPPVDMRLYKKIPMGAGLGGGSSDGAFMLKALNDKFQLQLDDRQLREYAGRLGSDCPFFLVNQPCYATGRGELLEPVALDLSGHSIVFIHPGVHVKTAWAFAQLKPARPERSIKEIIGGPLSDWKTFLTNDFEKPVIKEYPQLASLKDKLYSAGAVYASMTGSGSSFFGIFPKEIDPVFPAEEDFQVVRLT
ncbi:MAG: 4-(cytidine 5'-diphospho)-2-C-methyl-D-erythritol kinase [Puia sp.]|nr:4-(cytidine 5'-diphospho)-2-C-methyl-D-erythritol kinase [Puia sp.]